MKFSQRMGITAAEKIIQIQSVDDDLRNSLWNALTISYWDKFNRSKWDMGTRIDFIARSNLSSLFDALWMLYFKRPIDSIPTYFYDDIGGLEVLRRYFYSASWYQIFDFIEFVSKNGADEVRNEFIAVCNKFLERENSAYRFVKESIVEISSQDEVKEVENAISSSTPFYGVKKHLESAITLMGDRSNPDYRNSIKESISAVECLCKHISGDKKATLSSALKALEAKGLMHPALKSAFSSLYGYTSDADGIRHSLMAESNLTMADARFMLISCSAFVNYVIAVT